jgi:2-polyprenyl-6-methoxyphenol hydroxylase-like FAD-dependent oxidoreductase
VTGLRVAVIGAGLGGLCLAQGLHGAGADVTVYERDAALDSRQQGYRLHVDARAGLALRSCLAPDLFELFLATCGRPGRRFTLLSERLRVLHEVAGDPGRDPFAAESLSTSVNRQTLREILAARLGRRIRFGCELTRFDPGDGGVRLDFSGGRHAEADLLVGADGLNSAVRRQYLPDARVIDTGSRCIYGKTPLTDAALRLLPPSLLDGFTAIVGGQVGMAAGLGPEGLHGIAATMVRSWHPDLRGLVGLADIGQTFLVRIRTSVPVPAWEPGPVTLLGDAIHAMSPARGSGANTALQDAGVLYRTLAGAAPARQPLIAAIGGYESQMRDYGFAAVRASREAEAEMGTRRSGIAFWLYRRLARTRSG